jgi:ubiquitin-conjugating enzyme E2 variant
MYELKMICTEDYPNVPPKIKFINKINMQCVNQETGWVDPNQVDDLKHWTKESTLETALKGVRKEMESHAYKRLKQPGENETFP